MFHVEHFCGLQRNDSRLRNLHFSGSIQAQRAVVMFHVEHYDRLDAFAISS
jgi:hypothetical protein